MKPNDLSVVLTGATGSVGAALARELVARGARVLLVARTAAPLVALARELAREDDNRHRIDALAADVTSASARIGIRDAAVARNVNALINAASADEPGPLYELDATRVDAVLQTNLGAAMQLTRALLPHLLRQPEARVLNLGSALALTALPGAAVYSASQFGLRGFAEALRRELADTNVRVQFLGRQPASPVHDPHELDEDQVRERSEVPEYVASVALRMLLAGSSERFLGISNTVLGRLNALMPLWLDSTLKRRHVVPRRRKAAPT
ncbi:MAG TPA: SDR family NAD(P)-dependent oxidoreductase [Burkholderiaceae bacterium]|nr:SDR family NAD(P)-dependent oxidoreductase [Burkholderiaceae bacterium]